MSSAIEKAIAESREREGKASERPWFWEHDDNEGYKIYVERMTGPLYLMQFSFADNDVKFSAAARTWEPRFRDGFATLHEWMRVNVREMDCRGDEDCDHCAGLDALERAKNLILTGRAT
jgi:hypothetical protein